MRTPEERLRGAKKSTIYKSLNTLLNRRTKCGTDCKYFDDCPVSGASYGYHDKLHPEQDRKCLMREFPESVRMQFIHMFLTGEEGFIRGIKTVMHNYMNDVETYGTLKDKRDMIRLLIDLFEKIYSKRTENGLTRAPLEIVIRRVTGNVETHESITVTPHEQLPDGVRPSFGRETKDITELDPESLIHSPHLERIVRGPRLAEEITIRTNIDQIMETQDETDE